MTNLGNGWRETQRGRGGERGRVREEIKKI